MRAAILVFLALLPRQETPGPEKYRYVRLTSKGSRTECTFTIKRDEAGRAITSVTERGRTVMTVAARYDAEGRVVSAEAKLNTGGAVEVRTADGKATVRRQGREPQEFEVPRGAIVTSAPDWTDTFSLCRLYDAAKSGRQEFEGLWIHPTRPSFRLKFSVEPAGKASIRHGGKDIDLLRLTLRLRNNSRYAAWTDSKGRMVKLVSLPFKPNGFQMSLAGFEESAAGLKPE